LTTRGGSAGDRRLPLDEVFHHGARAIVLVVSTSRSLTCVLGGLTLLAGLLPAAAAWVSKWIIDGVVLAARTGLPADRQEVVQYVLAEAAIMVLLVGVRRAHSVTKSLLYARLGYRVNLDILDKAQTLDLMQYEDPQCQTLLLQAKREAASRPFSLINRLFLVLQHSVALVAFTGLLLSFSPLAVGVIALAGLPAFAVEAYFSGKVFRFYHSKTPTMRERAYLESLMTRDDFAKEVLHFELGPALRERYKTLFQLLFDSDQRLQMSRGAWGFALSLVSSAAFYSAYIWTVLTAIDGRITLGEMTMYLTLFRQGQGSLATLLGSIGGMYEDVLYVAQLHAFLGLPGGLRRGNARQGAVPGDGLRCEEVSFTYPGAGRAALGGVSFHLRPGERLGIIGANGCGKTTLVKLLVGLYRPDSGRVLLDGTDLRDWQLESLRRRIGILFQGYQRYKLTAGENISAGDALRSNDETELARAARLGLADELIAELPEGLATRLGKPQGRELSGGQWQRLALARAFMRQEADVLILDEPTASLDTATEAGIFSHLREVAGDRMTVLTSHRLATVRFADHILVLDGGRILEEGAHDALITRGGLYARLFRLQASGYRESP
jgi:ATP-binding cassette subfamily B protein